MIAFIDIRSILSSKGFFLYHIIHPEATGVSFWQKRKLRISQATGKKYGEKSVLKQNNICNHGKHIEIFEKEVIIFGKCLRLSGRMLTSFPKNTSSFYPEHKLFLPQSPASDPKRPPFCTFFLRLARKRSGTRQTNPLFSNFLMRNSAYRDH